MQSTTLTGYRLSPQQEHLWQFNPTANSQCSITIQGNLNPEILKFAIQNIVNQYEIFRTNFACLPQTTVPVQIIRDRQSISLDYYDWDSLPIPNQNLKMAELSQQQSYKTVNLETESLLQLTLVKLSAKKHVLLVTLPTAIADVISLQNFVREISIFYTAAINNQEVDNDILQYADIAEWQHELLLEPKGKAYWQNKNISSLPIKLPFEQHLNQDIQYKSLKVNIVKQRNDNLPVNYASWLLTCWIVLLWRNTDVVEITINSLYDGRKHEELRSAIGLFAKYLPLEFSLKPDLSFSQVWQQVQASVEEAYQWQDYFVGQQNERDFTDLPIAFDFIESLPQYTAGEISFAISQQYACIDRCKLKLSCWHQDDDLLLELHYDPRIYQAQDICRLTEQFQQLLTSAANNPQTLISELEILGDREKHQLLTEFNNTQTPRPSYQLIHQLFAAQAARTPDNIAVIFQEEKLTYDELNRRADKLANYLQQLGVKPETVVGICVEKSLEMIIGILAILKAGGAYLPLDPAYPQERLAFVLQDTQAPIVLTQQKLVQKLPTHLAKVLCLDTDLQDIETASQSNYVVHSTNLAYIIYTSGSTGKPKGVQISHQNLVHSTQARINYYQESVTSFLLLSSFAFDSSVAGIFWTLCSGGALILPQPKGEQDIPYLLDLITQHQISHVLSLSSLYALLLEQAKPVQLASLQNVIVAGESCLPALVTHHQQLLPQTSLYNEYGPTEGTVWSSATKLSIPVSIGRPIANTQIYLLNSRLHPVPLGVAGEVYISGDGIARGYYNRPELTAERFIPHPFSDVQGLRLYKTGDLARYLADGNIEFLGRIDQQVKIRGFRIELGEIETAIMQHPSIRTSIVVARKDKSDFQRLIAYIIPESGQIAPTFTQLHQFLQSQLPDYMMPSALACISTIPRLPNGKIDLKSLPDPELSRTFVAPRTTTEKTLAQIWQQVLRLQQVGIHDNFFELGGDSIVSIQMVSKANRAGLKLTPRQIFEQPTIAQLGALALATPTTAIEQGLVTGAVPLTPIQHWFLAQNQPDAHHWNQSLLLEVAPGCNPDLWEQILQHLLDHHDALRLNFQQQESDWQQIISSQQREVFTKVDLSALPEVEQKLAIETTATKLQASLNLAESLVKFAWFDLGRSRSRLLIIVHHLAIDGVSWRILIEDLQTAYQQLSQGEAITLPAKTTSWQTWALHLQEYSQSLKQLNYWSTQLQKPATALPVDDAGGKNTVAEANTVSVYLSQQETQALLQEVHQAYRTQINDVLLTALLQTLTQWTAESSFLLELEGHGREEVFADVDLSRTVGWFTTHFPVWLEWQDSDLGNILKAVKEQLRSLPDRGFDYGVLRYLSNAREKLPVSQAEVLFNYLGQTDQILSSSLFVRAAESIGANRSPRGRRNYLLEITAVVLGDRLQVNWTYSQQIHHRTTIEKLAADFIAKLRSLIVYCQAPPDAGYTPSDFPQAKLNSQDLNKFLAKFNRPSEETN